MSGGIWVSVSRVPGMSVSEAAGTFTSTGAMRSGSRGHCASLALQARASALGGPVPSGERHPHVQLPAHHGIDPEPASLDVPPPLPPVGLRGHVPCGAVWQPEVKMRSLQVGLSLDLDQANGHLSHLLLREPLRRPEARDAFLVLVLVLVLAA